MSDPYITFSDDMRYAFVEHTAAVHTDGLAILALDRFLSDGWRPEIPLLDSWSVNRAYVVGIEIWDERIGRCLPRPTDHSRTLWRVMVADALVCTDLGNPVATDDLLLTLRWLNRTGRLADDVLDRVLILLYCFEDEEQDRCRRQALRSPGAPRAQLQSNVGVQLARTLLALVVDVVGDAPSTGWRSVERALAAAAIREEERQVAELRAALDAYGQLPPRVEGA